MAENLSEIKTETPTNEVVEVVKESPQETAAVSAVTPPPKPSFWQRFKKKPKTVEAADTDDKKTEPLPLKPADTLEANLKAMAAHMEMKERNDYWHIRLNKKLVIIGGGLLIIAMWLGGGLWHLTSDKKWQIKDWRLIGQKAAVTVSPTPLPKEVIRIRYKFPESATEAASLAQKLEAMGLPVTDTILDSQSDYDGVLVVSKATKIDLRDRIEGILAENYLLASPGAELTPDSDFDAIVLFAPNASRAAALK